ncbi:MAG: hypothetical protein A2339_00395 [Elusimicrobia bacterium RIFOXYB12_FULL_50_12]|nr:MAG: hypothetical protein A2339_00395 [Elusimicrobia bacterium RIFOXYB12_FULL_50_12]
MAYLGFAPDQECGSTNKKPPGAVFRGSPGGVRGMDAPNKKPSGAGFRASPGGVRRRDAPNKRIGLVSLAFFAVEKRFLDL